MITARGQYDERPVMASDLSFEGDKGVTKQSDMKDADINAIFKRFERTGQLPDLIVKNPQYGDFSSPMDYQEALNIVIHADEQWNALDVSIRNRFGGDRKAFLAFMEDPKNIDEVENMGLLKPEVVAARQAARDQKNAEIKAAIEKAAIDKLKAELGK